MPKMIVTCVYVTVKKESIDDFIRASVENHLESIKEMGNLRFDLIQQSDDPSRFMIYEGYESEEFAAFHKSTSHYLKWRDIVQEMMEEPRRGVRYNIIQPEEVRK